MPSDISLYVILALLVGAMWFMSRRSRRQQQKQQEFRDNLKPGDEVMTGSGLFGTVVEVVGDQVTLESTPGSRTRWLKAAIAKLVEPTALDEDADDDDAEDESDDEDYDDEDYADEDDELDEDIEVPDDLSSLDDAPGDDHPDGKDTK